MISILLFHYRDRHFVFRLLTILVLTLACMLNWSERAARCEPSRNPHAFAGLQKRLIRDGFDRSMIRAIYSKPQMNFDGQGVTVYFLHREASLNYDQFVAQPSIKPAKRYLSKHQGALERADKRYGVEPEVITAIILVESNLGTLIGRHLVISTLSSLAAAADKANQDIAWSTYVKPKVPDSRGEFSTWVDRKSAWAYRELKAYLKYVSKESLDPFSIYGSFAGALGIAQFIPSSVLRYAQDGNRDGQINLSHHEDSIESIANYLKQHGWRHGLSRKRAFRIVLKYNNSKYYANCILKVADRLSGRRRR